MDNWRRAKENIEEIFILAFPELIFHAQSLNRANREIVFFVGDKQLKTPDPGSDRVKDLLERLGMGLYGEQVTKTAEAV